VFLPNQRGMRRCIIPLPRLPEKETHPIKMRVANGVELEFGEMGDAWDNCGRVIKAPDHRSRDQRAVDLLYLLASHGIALRPRGPDFNLLSAPVFELSREVRMEILDLKPELLQRLRIGGMPLPLCGRLSALGWSSERIAEVRLGKDEIVINVESDAVTIVRESDWGNMRKVHRCQKCN
jgi:hypothetical protein